MAIEKIMDEWEFIDTVCLNGRNGKLDEKGGLPPSASNMLLHYLLQYREIQLRPATNDCMRELNSRGYVEVYGRDKKESPA